MVYFLVSSSKKQTTLSPFPSFPLPHLGVVWFGFCLGILYDGIFNEFTFSSVSHSICICVCIRGVCLGLSCGLTAYIFSKKIYYIKNVHKMKGVNLFIKLTFCLAGPHFPPPCRSSFFLFCTLLLPSGNRQRCSR